MTENITLKQSNNNDIQDIMSIISKCNEKLKRSGIVQWDEYYPTKSVFEEDISKKTLFSIILAEEIIGCLCINEEECPEYKMVNWKYNNFMVVHRLAIKPIHQGKGYAKKVMCLAEEHIKNSSKESIRLEAYLPNIAAIRLYESMNYVSRGVIEFRRGLFRIFEKSLV